MSFKAENTIVSEEEGMPVIWKNIPKKPEQFGQRKPQTFKEEGRQDKNRAGEGFRLHTDLVGLHLTGWCGPLIEVKMENFCLNNGH